MKALVFSDMHGSAEAALFMAKTIEATPVDTVLLLGDILYHGPRNPLPASYDPKSVCNTLAPFASKIIAVSGNCDSEVDTMVLPFPVAPSFLWVISDGLRIFVTHGHHFSPTSLPPLQEDDIFLSGHTHIPVAERKNAVYLCNPGSITLPKEEHPKSYGIIETSGFTVLTEQHEPYLHINF